VFRFENGQAVEHLLAALSEKATETPARSYKAIHRVLAEGDFVLSVCECMLGETHCSFYDLYRIADDKVVEHWDTVDPIPPRNEWNNDNGKV
jgi:predicted SnoaL-like aldol condensation-catalyzing enzyme